MDKTRNLYLTLDAPECKRSDGSFEIELSSGFVWKIRAPDFVIVDEFGQGRIALLNEDHTFSTVSGLHVVRVGIARAA
jgi:hypothetical protein